MSGSSNLGGAGNRISTELGVATSNKLLWRAILYAEFDYDWPPWDTLSGGVRRLCCAGLGRVPGTGFKCLWCIALWCLALPAGGLLKASRLFETAARMNVPAGPGASLDQIISGCCMYILNELAGPQ